MTKIRLEKGASFIEISAVGRYLFVDEDELESTSPSPVSLKPRTPGPRSSGSARPLVRPQASPAPVLAPAARVPSGP